MENKTHESIVGDQFGSQAGAYLASPVHARGEDLDRLARLVGTRPAARALDLGCGGGHVAFRLAPAVGQVVACDLSPDMLAAVAAEAVRRGLGNVATEQGLAERLPFADARFDVVASRHSAHHWHDLEAGLREARRVLRPDGLAVFMDVVAPESVLGDTFFQTIEMLRDPSHVRDYSVREWRRAVESAGFAVRSVACHRVWLDFASWTARMRTPEDHVRAIRSLQGRAAAEIAEYFAIEADGSFTIDTMTLEAVPTPH